jgi:hypothetical protein
MMYVISGSRSTGENEEHDKLLLGVYQTYFADINVMQLYFSIQVNTVVHVPSKYLSPYFLHNGLLRQTVACKGHDSKSAKNGPC